MRPDAPIKRRASSGSLSQPTSWWGTVVGREHPKPRRRDVKILTFDVKFNLRLDQNAMVETPMHSVM